MDDTNTAAMIGVAIAASALVVTVVVLLFRGNYIPGANVNRVNNLDKKADELTQAVNGLRSETQQGDQKLREDMNTGFDKLAGMIDARCVEVQQTNQTVAALANHAHDTGGRTMFALPPRTSG